ncbi:MAG: sulfatase-like hydrolase/transferase [Candidatus Eisenbacteria sp.]|nr:sulfatase-like hydrolase/transferase [Candidatus Eisenbacteria bacterium]
MDRQPATGPWAKTVLALIFGAVLAGSLIASLEGVFITLSYGPYWLRPWVFLKSWLLYSASALVGLTILSLAIFAIPRLRRFLNDPPRASFIAFLLSWIIGCALLVALIHRDLHGAPPYWQFAVAAILCGSTATLVLHRIMQTTRAFYLPPLLLSLCLLALAVLTYFISDWSATRALRERNAHCTGSIPNLCLIVLDTARGDHFSSCGYPHKTTPHIDRLSAEGLLCTDAYSASNWTPPGHVSIFTGLNPSQHRNDGLPRTPDELLTLTEILNCLGYFSIAMYNNNLAGRTTNLTQGFDVDVGVYQDCWFYPAWQRLYDAFLCKDSGSKTSFFAAFQVLKWIRQREGHLFLYINVMEPHKPYVIHEPYFSSFTEDLSLESIPNLRAVQRECASVSQVFHDSTRVAAYAPESFAYVRAAYDSELAYVDHQLGQLAQNLRSTELLDDILLVITADHGEFLGERFTFGHPRLLFNPVLRIPLVIRYPRLVPSVIIGDPVSNVDILPTVLSLMGYPEMIPGDVQGIDLMSDPRLGQRPLLFENVRGRGVYSMLDQSYKLMMSEEPKFLEVAPYDTLLFDLHADPHEEKDLHSEQRDLCTRMIRDLRDWTERIRTTSQSDTTIDEETIRKLRALGYIQ